MSIWEEIKGIRKMLLGSELPDDITATITDAVIAESEKKYGTQRALKLTLKLTQMGDVFEGREVVTTYRIPKAYTGKGHMDKLIEHAKKLELELEELVGKTFKWKRKELTGSMKGNPRHYPVEVVE